MIISHRKKFIFIHVPKTGGSSILGGLIPALDQKTVGKPNAHGWQPKLHKGPMHLRICDRTVLAQVMAHPDYFSFGFVRHPYDWVLSRYGFEGKGRSLERYLREDRNRKSYHGCWNWPLSSWLEYKKAKVDFIGKLETIKEDFAVIAERLGVKPEVPHYNAGKKKKGYAISDEAKKMIVEFHGEDMERFGYD